MAQLSRGQTSGCGNPALDLFTSVAGQLVDIAVLELQIFDVSSAAKRAMPVQVFPAAGRQLTDVAHDCPAGDRLGLGHYVARWTVPDDEPPGTHEIRWYFRLTLESPEQAFVEEFEIVPVVAGGVTHGYCEVADLRAEGVTEAQASDARLAVLIEEASRTIDQLTGCFFAPRVLTLRLDGRGTPTLEPPAPVIRLDRLTVGGTDLALGPEHLVVIGAPAAPGFDGPRLMLRHGRVFPPGYGNVEVEGVFGFTEEDGAPFGRTPLAIRRACLLLVLRGVPRLADGQAADARNAWRLLEERTRDQSYRLDSVRRPGPFTGDPEIDDILLRYRRPAGLGAA